MPTSDAMVRESRGTARQIERFLDHLAVERGVAPNTRTAYRRDLALYLKYLTARGVTDAGAVQETDISEFLASLRSEEYAPGKHYSDATIAHVLASSKPARKRPCS